MGLFQRIFKLGQAEAHNAINKLEDPIKLTEQGIRDLKKDLDESLKALAEVKALEIRSRREVDENTNRAKSYEAKAVKLLQAGANGSMDSAEADRLASEALSRKAEVERAAAQARGHYEQLQVQINNINKSVEKIRSNVSKYENELKMLKARSKVSSATKKINKSLSGIDSNGTVAMLERMKDQVAEDEALAEAYGEVANESKSIDDEIDAALDSTSSSANSELEALKAKLKKKS
jgi:phage shock protein A